MLSNLTRQEATPAQWQYDAVVVRIAQVNND